MARSEKFTFAGHDGGALDGRLELPTGPVRAYALFAHCFTCGKDGHAATRVSRGLAAAGIATLRFDFTGLGGSAGDFGNAGFTCDVQDIVAAGRAMAAAGKPVGLLVGHSLGGAAVIAAAGKMAEVEAVATIGAPFDVGHVLHHFGEQLRALDGRERTTVKLAARTFEIGRTFVERLRGQPQGQRLADLHKPLLVMHAPADEVVAIESARRIFEAARHPKSFVSLDGADHLLTDARHAAWAAGMLAAWADRYLPAQTVLAEPDASEGVVLVAGAGIGRFQHSVLAGAHRFITDEPTRIGGDDAGPSPYDLLLAALGACTAMTLRLYAERKGIPLADARVQLRHERCHGEDCGVWARLERIERVIELVGDLSAAQRTRLLEIADKCPVHRTLTEGVEIATTPAPPAA